MIFKPHDYQSYCIEYIRAHPIAALLLDMGLGKTVITLTGIRDLMLDTCEVPKTLVIAPLRVARDTWPAEVEKWDHLRYLDVSVIVGTSKERLAAINYPALVYVVNRENVKFLMEHYEKNGLRWDFDLVVIDERISDITISMKALDYLDMPDCVYTQHYVEMDKKEREYYDRLRRDLINPLEDAEIDAANAASLTGKLDALEDLIEATNGQPDLEPRVLPADQRQTMSPISGINGRLF